MLEQSKFVQVADFDLKFGLWKYSGGVVRFSGGRMYVLASDQKQVDKKNERQ